MVILILHILIAISSLFFAGLSLFVSSSRLQNLNYALVAGVVATGLGVVLIKNVSLMHACLSGLAYLFVVGSIIIFSNRKLAFKKINAK